MGLVQPSTKPSSLPTSITPVGERLVRIAVGPIWTYATLAEAVVLRAQLDEQIQAMSEGFL